MELRVLGPLQVSVAGQPVVVGTARKRRVVLAALLSRAGQVVPVDLLIAAVWGDRPPASARRNLQLYVHQLGRVLPDGSICARGNGYLVDPGDALDAVRFRRLAAAGDASLAAGDPAIAAATLRAALDLWRGPAFGEFLDCELVRDEAQRLELRRLATYERWAEAQLAIGATPSLAAELAELCRLHPYRESLRGHLMRALYQSGRQAEALAEFRRARAMLVDQLGVEPCESLRRLHQQILAADPALLPTAATVSGPNVLPRQLPAPPRVFTGRARELAALDQAVDASTVVISAIDGMAGVGKTALALHAAHRIADRYPGGQLFIDLHGYTQGVDPIEPGEALDRMLRGLGVPGPQIPTGLDERAALYRTRLADRRVLIVLDNAATEAQVQPLLPGAAGCLVLVTSRRRLAGLDDTRTLSLDTLPAADAVALFAQAAGDHRLADQPPELVTELVELCFRLPLAIAIAAARLRSHPTWPLSHLVARLRDQRHRLAELAAGQHSVTAALDLSYQHQDSARQRTYRLLGLHPGPDIDPYATAALLGATLPQASRLLDQLLDVHLLLEPAAGRYQFHDLTRAHAAGTAAHDQLQSAGRAALDRLLDYYRHAACLAMDAAYPYERARRPQVPPAGTPVSDLPDPAAALEWLDTELPNLLAVARHAAEHGWPSHVVHLSRILHQHLHTRGHYHDAEALHQSAVATARTIGDRAGELAALTRLGQIHRRQGQYERAAEQYRHALEIARATGDRAGEPDALNGLGDIHWVKGLYERAAGHYRQALEIARATGNGLGELDALNGLADIHWIQGRYEQAADQFGQALRIARVTGDRAGERVALIGLGWIDLEQGRYEAAAGHQQQALQIAHATGHQAGKLAALTGLGQVRRRQGRFEQAAHHFGQALAFARTTGHRGGELGALLGLGQLYRTLGRHQQATDHFLELLRLAEESGDRNFQFEARQGLGRLRLAAGDPGAAIAYHDQALALADELGQPIDQARAHDGLAHAYLALHHRDQARGHWQRAVDLLASLRVEHTHDEETNVAAIRDHLARLTSGTDHRAPEPAR